MTLPNQAAGLATIGLEFAFSSGDSGVTGMLDSIPGAINRTQSAITEVLKDQMRQSTGWNAAHQAGYSELIPGVPFVPNIVFQMADMLVDMTPLGPFFNLSDISDFFTSGASTLFGGLIPGLDTSKIISGEFPMAMITGLLDFVNDLPFIGSIVEALTGSLGDLADLSSWADLLPLLSGGFLSSGIIPGLDASKIISGTFGTGLLQPIIDAVAAGFGGSSGLGFSGLTDFLSSLVFGGADWGELFTGITGQTGGLPEIIDLFTGGLFGNIDPGRISFVPTGAIGTDSKNLFSNPGFDGAISMEQAYGWTWDGTFGHTSVGSATIVADGAEHTLFTNPVAVDVNQTIPMGIWVHHTGLTATPGQNALQFAVQAYEGTGPAASFISETMLAGIASPSGSSSNPGENNFIHLESTYTVPAGVDEIRGVAKVTPAATAGTVHYDDAHAQTTRLLPIPFIDGLPTQLSDLVDFGEGIVSTIYSALGGGSIGSLDPFEALTSIMQSIPSMFVTGWGGPGSAADTWQATWDQIISGGVGAIGTGSTLADLFNTFFQVSSNAAQGPMAFNLFGGLNNTRAFFRGRLPSSDTTLPISQVMFNKVSGVPTVPTFAITQAGGAYTVWHIIQQDATKAIVQWRGHLTGSPNTDFRARVLKMDSTNGTVTPQQVSGNLIGALSVTPGDYATWTLGTPMAVVAGDIIGLEFQLIGAGAYNMVGDQTWDTTPHPTVFPQRMASIRSGSGTTTTLGSSYAHLSGFAYTDKIAVAEFAISTGNPPAPHAPSLNTFSTVGSSTIPVPDWCNEVQLIVVPGGGKGASGSGTLGINGDGGNAGTIGTLTLTRGTHFTTGAVVDYTVGAGSTGSGGGTSSAGIGANTVSRTGGTDGSGWVSGSAAYGASPGSTTVDSVPYNGGAQQTSLGSLGNAPGGAGSGGGYLQSGGNGGKGTVWVRFKQ